MIFSKSRDTLPTKTEDEEPFFKTPPSRFSAACPSHAKNVYKKRDFKACEHPRNRSILCVCEDFEVERNAEITFLGAFFTTRSP